MFNEDVAKVIATVCRRRADGIVQLLGTCFAVSANKFATAAHVTGPSDIGLSAIFNRVSRISDYQDTTNLTGQAVEMKLAAYDPLRDISIIEFSSQSDRVSFPYNISSTDNVTSGTPVVSFGFPHADAGRLVLTLQSSIVGARILLDNRGLKAKHLVLNTQTRPGQSGGPVFSADGRQVHAMILGGYVPTEHPVMSIVGLDPHTLHQTTHAISAEYLTAMMQ